MQPEISRRCLSCGAAVRAGARFCPQCGEPVSGADASQTDDGSQRASASGTESVLSETRDADAPREWVTPAKEFSSFVQSLGGERQREGASGASAPDASTSEAARADTRGGDTAATTPLTEMGASANADANASANADADASADAGRREEDKRSRVARVRETTRARVETTRARVEKMKDDALVALEETPDDSGLRFVVVAVAVFLLFLLILLLSTTILR
jgi:hypothetical protein